MMNQLEEVAMAEYRWELSAKGVIDLGWEISEQVETEAEVLASSVVNGVVSIEDLRGGVVWANALDCEAVHAHGGDLSEGSEVYERTARRIMHLSGRTALEALKTTKKRSVAQVRLNNAGRVIG